MKKQLAIFSLLAMAAWNVNAQDPHFSQYFVSPLTVNPALTGFMDGSARAALNHRSQWASANNAFTTTTVSLDGIILPGKIPASDRFGVGLMLMSDQAADGLLKSTYLGVSTAYHKGLDAAGNFSVAVGLQGSYANRSIDGGRLNLNDELDEFGGFTIPSGEAIDQRQVTRNYFDVSGGVLFKGKINDNNQFYIGASMYHLARPKATFMNDISLRVPIRMTINGAYEAKVSEILSISLVGLYMKQEAATETVVGGIATIGKSYREYEKSLVGYLGFLYRVNDAFIPYVGVEYSDVRVGCSYDLTTSNLSQANKSQGGVELSIIYLLRIPPNKKIIYLCPNNPKF